MERTQNKGGITEDQRAAESNPSLWRGAMGPGQDAGRQSQKDGEKVTKSQGLGAYYIVRGEVVAIAPSAFPKLIRRKNLRWEEVNKLIVPLDTLIEHYIVELRSENKSPKTISWYLANLRAFEAWLKCHRHSTLLGDLDIDIVRRYILYLQDGHRKFEGHPYTPARDEPLSEYSVQGHVRTLRAFVSWLKREGYLDENFLSRLKVPKAPSLVIRPLTEGEISKILACFNPDTTTGARNLALVWLMLDSGLRIGEVADLQYGNVNLQQAQLMVRGKGSKERVVPVGRKAQKYLQRYIYHFRPEPLYPDRDNLFLTLEGKPLKDNALKLMFSRLRARTGIARLHGHLLRHTFATRYLMNGGDILSLKRILGHASIQMVARYTHLSEADVVAKHHLFSPMDRLDLKPIKRADRTHRRRSS